MKVKRKKVEKTEETPSVVANDFFPLAMEICEVIDHYREHEDVSYIASPSKLALVCALRCYQLGLRQVIPSTVKSMMDEFGLEARWRYNEQNHTWTYWGPDPKRRVKDAVESLDAVLQKKSLQTLDGATIEDLEEVAKRVIRVFQDSTVDRPRAGGYGMGSVPKGNRKFYPSRDGSTDAPKEREGDSRAVTKVVVKKSKRPGKTIQG